MTIREFELVNTSLVTNYSILSRKNRIIVKRIKVDYTAPFSEFSKSKDFLNRYLYADVTSIDVINGILDISAEVID